MEAFNKNILKLIYLTYDEKDDSFELNKAIADFLLYYMEENILLSIHHMK